MKTIMSGLATALIIVIAISGGVSVTYAQVNDLEIISPDGMVISYSYGGYMWHEASPYYRQLGSKTAIQSYLNEIEEDLADATSDLNKQGRDNVENPSIWGTFAQGETNQPVAYVAGSTFTSFPRRGGSYRGSVSKETLQFSNDGSAVAKVNSKDRQITELRLRFKTRRHELTAPLPINSDGTFQGAIGDFGYVYGWLQGRNGDMLGVFYSKDFKQVGAFSACKPVTVEGGIERYYPCL